MENRKALEAFQQLVVREAANIYSAPSKIEAFEKIVYAPTHIHDQAGETHVMPIQFVPRLHPQFTEDGYGVFETFEQSDEALAACGFKNYDTVSVPMAFHEFIFSYISEQAIRDIYIVHPSGSKVSITIERACVLLEEYFTHLGARLTAGVRPEVSTRRKASISEENIETITDIFSPMEGYADYRIIDAEVFGEQM